MLANVALSLREQLKWATGSIHTQETALITAGMIIARYVEATPFTRGGADGQKIEPLSLTPELLTNEDSYPRIKFTVAKERIEDAIAILKAIDARSPTMPGLTFNQLVCCNEESCMIVINAGSSLVCEFAGEIACKIPPTAPGDKKVPVPALGNVS